MAKNKDTEGEENEPQVKKKKDAIDFTYRGQPAYYESPEQLWEKAVEYFKSVTTSSGIIKATISGVTRHCGFASRSSWLQYEERSPEFLHTVHTIKMIVIEWYERNLHGFNWAGSAFALRNMDSGNWKDEVIQQQHQTITNVTPNIIQGPVALESKEE
jgi:hypothetical protein